MKDAVSPTPGRVGIWPTPGSWPDEAYCDGGVVGRNPSALGITWAWCWVVGSRITRRESGVLEPDDLGTSLATNNHAELIAALKCLDALPPGWDGVLYTDSEVTLTRLTKWPTPPFVGCPPWLVQRLIKARRQPPKMALLGGHPTRKELAAGWVRRNGLPCSRWNVWCDEECGRLAKEFRRSHAAAE